MQNRYSFIFAIFIGIGLLTWFYTSPPKGSPLSSSSDSSNPIPSQREASESSAPASEPSHGDETKEDTNTTATPPSSSRPEERPDDKAVGASSRPPRPRTFTQSTHLAYLRSLGVKETTTFTDAGGETERLSLVHDPDGGFPYVIIHEHIQPGAAKPYMTYAQVADQFVVRFKEDPSPQELSSFLSNHELKVDGEGSLIARSYLIKFDNVTPKRIIDLKKELESDPRIESADANKFVYASALPNDPQISRLWGLTGQGEAKKNTNIRATQAWDLLTDCSATPVAVLDTGIDSNHPDLKDNVRTELSASFVGGNGNTDGNGHGTHVAGTIGAIGNNNIGVSGICWKASLIAIKVLGERGSGTDASVIRGLEYARTSPAKVINMSLGGTGQPGVSEIAALKSVTDSGKLVIVAAGNDTLDNDVTPGFPATVSNPNKISVAALDSRGNLASFSNYGATSVDIAAPGVGILSTTRGTYDALSGTSMAAPHVAGAAALFWSYAPNFTAKEVKDLILASSSKETFARPIVGGRKLDLFQLMTSIQATIKIEALESGSSLKINGPQTTLSMESVAPYAKIAKVELLRDGKVIASANGQAREINVPWIQTTDTLTLQVRVTDTDGRSTMSKEIAVPISLEKTIDFSKVDVGKAAEKVVCKVTKQEKNQETNLHERRLESDQVCKAFCSIVGPLTYFSRAEVRCGSGDNIYYQKNPGV